MTDIKFCGMQSKKDVENAAAAGATALGFVFANSKRQVAPEAVNEWLASVHLHEQKTVAVFADPDATEVKTTLEKVSLDVLQFHGDESSEFLKAVKKSTGKRVIKAFRHQEKTLDLLSAFAPVADGFIVDAGTKMQKGGTGQRFDWGSVPVYVHFAQQLNRPLWIAGGVSPENVPELLSFHPDGIDVSSGIETEHQKDQGKMETIVKQVREDGYVVS
ncbi:phosphoribosylanthranilate isomerase [Salicibibacter cibarius]|uniref:N-(5'-phosphoribosyl)anthranilate isomerase n=1 Tax=Salicibibacter cibarius TaxID=2743000 RepID=A0A7T6Z369_9BACI|nr:phosphoribosylanthranilate isomerase [Salicibibacter cibarius]QQK76021.1 phosphoribosylanthranilate isomerase [Salicibibacter cibarius]